MGGFRFKATPDGEFINTDSSLRIPPLTDLHELIAASKEVVKSERNNILPDKRWIAQLVQSGSSLGGARPKANVMNPTLNDHQSLLINSRSNESDPSILLNSCEEYMLTTDVAKSIINEVAATVRDWRSLANRLGVPKREMSLFEGVFDSRAALGRSIILWRKSEGQDAAREIHICPFLLLSATSRRLPESRCRSPRSCAARCLPTDSASADDLRLIR